MAPTDLRELINGEPRLVAVLDRPPYIVTEGVEELLDGYKVLVRNGAYNGLGVMAVGRGAASPLYTPSQHVYDKLRGGILVRAVLRDPTALLDGEGEAQLLISGVETDPVTLSNYVVPVMVDRDYLLDLIERAGKILVRGRPYSRGSITLVKEYGYPIEELFRLYGGCPLTLYLGDNRLRIGSTRRCSLLIGDPQPPYVTIDNGLRIVWRL